jgi:hypothetical protein
MLIKNYTASTMREALAEIKNDLGTNAVILDTRVENGLTERAGGPGARVTVTAASESPKGVVKSFKPPVLGPDGPKTLHLKGELGHERSVVVEAAPQQGPETVEPDATAAGGADLLERVAHIEQLLSGLAESRALHEPAVGEEGWFADGDIREWLNSEHRLKTELTDAYAGYLLDRIPAPDPFLSARQLPETVCFVGPPGSGVSTMLMKSLAYWWRTQKVAPPVVEVQGEHAPDGGRLASWAKLFDLEHKRFRFDEIDRLSRYLSAHNEGPVFVKCELPAEDEGGLRVARRLARAVDAKIVVLVLSSLVRRKYNSLFLERYKVFTPSHLCVSHWDDAQPHADVRYFSAASRLPLAYYTMGSAPCGQIEPFTNAELRAGIAMDICGDRPQPHGDEKKIFEE